MRTRRFIRSLYFVSVCACGPYCYAHGCRAHATSIVDSVALYRILIHAVYLVMLYALVFL